MEPRKATLLLLAVTPLALLTGLAVGPAGTENPLRILEALHNPHANPLLEGIARYRLTRTLAASILGAGLAASGLTYQYSLENPLADPYLLGVSTGAALGVVVAIATGHGLQPGIIYLLSLLMGLAAFALVAGISSYTGASPTSLIVAGVSVSYSLLGIIILILARHPTTRIPGFTWLFGTVAYVIPRYLAYTTAITIAGTTALYALGSRLYTLILGENVSESLGAKPRETRLASLAIASLIASSSVALAGPVGFIGLAAPWMARLAYGSRYRLVLAIALIIGADLTVASDLIVRLASAGSGEIPLTAVTALYGGPILYYLARRTGW